LNLDQFALRQRSPVQADRITLVELELFHHLFDQSLSYATCVYCTPYVGMCSGDDHEMSDITTDNSGILNASTLRRGYRGESDM
jgi:hypothetical protein